MTIKTLLVLAALATPAALATDVCEAGSTDFLAGTPPDRCTDCYECKNGRYDGADWLVDIVSKDTCKQAISWMCCVGFEANTAGLCDVRGCNGVGAGASDQQKCSSNVESITVKVPYGETAVYLSTHDGSYDTGDQNYQDSAVCGGNTGGGGNMKCFSNNNGLCLRQRVELSGCLPPPCEGSCTADPHFKKWDGTYYDFHGQCDLAFLSDPTFANGLGLDVQIRTKIQHSYSFIEVAAIQIGDDILEVTSWGQYTYNGVGAATMPAMLGPYPVEYTMVNKKKHEFMIRMEDGLSIEISTFKDWVNVKVHGATERNFGNAKGMMGEFRTGTMLARDGSTIMEDPNEFGNHWQVLDSEPKLFAVYPEESFQKCLMPVSTASQRRLGESIAQEAAELACAAHWDDAEHMEMCVYDVMASGDLEMAEAGVF